MLHWPDEGTRDEQGQPKGPLLQEGPVLIRFQEGSIAPGQEQFGVGGGGQWGFPQPRSSGQPEATSPDQRAKQVEGWCSLDTPPHIPV